MGCLLPLSLKNSDAGMDRILNASFFFFFSCVKKDECFIFPLYRVFHCCLGKQQCVDDKNVCNHMNKFPPVVKFCHSGAKLHNLTRE